MKKPVIAISREFGSGGRLIGELLAEKFALEIYDKTLISMVAEKSGYSRDFVEENDQKVTRSMLFQIAATGNLPPWISLDDETKAATKAKSVFSVQSEIIKDLASKGGCVIIGRCAGEILRSDPNCISVFISADKADKRERCIKEYGISPNAVDNELIRRDKERAEHYSLYTKRGWGKAENYDLCIDSSAFGIEGCVEMISRAIEIMSEK